MGPMSFPDRQTVLDYLRDNPNATTKQEIARGLRVKGKERNTLRQILKELEEEGVLERTGKRAWAQADRPPPTGVVEFTHLDDDGELIGKSVGDDFREGKMTAPVILACQKGSAEEKAFWRRTFADKVQSEEDLKTAQEILAKHNALEDGLEIARAYAAKARLALAEAPDSELRALLDDLVDFTVEREY